MIKIHLGCGKRNFGPDWIHIDGGDFPHVEYHDIEHLTKFQNESVDLIYASHVIEYFDREEVVPVLKEWNRVLARGGVLRLAVPDFKAMANLYVNRNYPLKNFLGPLYGKMRMGEKTIYHKTVYDVSDLADMIKKTGFRNCRVYDWRETEHAEIDDHSQAYLPHMDKEKGTLISLNIEAVK